MPQSSKFSIMFNSNESFAQTKNGQHEVMIFHYSQNSMKVQAINVNNEPWFIAADVCKILELSNVTKALDTLDDDEKLPLLIVRAGQQREVNCVSESGLYALIFKSRKPEARVIRKWVTSELLPSIRKKGYYGVKSEIKDDYLDMRDIPFYLQDINGSDVRYIDVDGEPWFSLNDIHKMIGSRTGSAQSARKLNAKQQLAKKIWIYRNTHPSWFVNLIGLQLLLSGSRVYSSNRQLALNF